MGRISAIFKADGAGNRFAVFHFRMVARTAYEGARSARAHPEDDIFYVVEGTMSVLVAGEWTHAREGLVRSCSRWRSPTTSKTAATRVRECSTSPSRARSSQHMPDIVRWFAENPPGVPGT